MGNQTVRDETRGLVREVKTQLWILGSLLALMWGVEIADQVLGGALDYFGIIPRTIIGLRGIVFAPFLHGNWPHLIANSLPFLGLGWLVMLRRTSDFFLVSAIAMVIGGLGTWLTGAPGSIHIGASGVIFGYLGFLLSLGFFERRLSSILVAIVVGLFYGGLIWGVLPTHYGISWQGHLFGLIGGIVAARFLAKPR